ncbi:hypothetical protein WJX77_007829 [Trebouxia sp. C0004]
MLLSTLGGASGLRVIAVACVGGRSRQLKLAFTGAKPHNSVSSKSRYSHRAIQKKQPLSKTFAAQGKNDKQLLTDDSQMPQTLPKVALVVLLLAVASTAFYVFGVQHISIKDIAASLDELVRSYGPLGPVIFVAAYVVATLVLIPSTALTLAAGYLFGPGFGTALVSLAATLGASLAFLISRYLAQPYAKAKLKAYPRLESIEEQISAEGIKLVLLLRLAPLIPFTILNYALGVTDIAFVPYLAATWLGKLPGIFSSVYLGSTGRSIDTVTSTGGINKMSFALNAVGVVASVLVTKLLADKASAVLRDDTFESDN